MEDLRGIDIEELLIEGDAPEVVFGGRRGACAALGGEEGGGIGLDFTALGVALKV